MSGRRVEPDQKKVWKEWAKQGSNPGEGREALIGGVRTVVSGGDDRRRRTGWLEWASRQVERGGESSGSRMCEENNEGVVFIYTRQEKH